MPNRRHQGVLTGRGGKSKEEIIADSTMPTMAMVINILVTLGKLLDNTVWLKRSLPKNKGSQPIHPIIIALVAQE